MTIGLGLNVRAAVFIWDGGHASQDKWSSQQNWNPNGNPPNDGTADLVFTGSIRLTPIADGGAWSINSLAFNSTAGAFTLGGGAVTLMAASVTFGVENASSNLQTINNALVLGSAQSWSATTAGLALNGTISLGANTLTLTGSYDTAATGAISGTGALVKTGTGTVTLSGANSYSGGTTISAGTLAGTTTSLQGNIVNNAGLVIDQTITGTYSGVISGTGTLTKLGSGTATLSGSNTYTGATTITAGTLSLAGSNTLADNSSVSVGSGATLQLAAAAETVGSIAGAGSIDLGSFTLTSGGTNASTTFSGAIGGTGGLVKTGTGTLTLSGANTYSGGTTISAGTLVVTSASLPGNAVNNAALVFDQAVNGTYSGIISGTGTFTKQNAATLSLTGANTYTGATSITGGTLALGVANALSSTTAVTVGSGATLQLSTGSQSIGSIAGSGALDLGSQALTTGGDGTSTTFSGIISGAGGSLTKTGAGTLALSGANTYSGGTTVSAGTLLGTTTSLQGNIANNSALVFDQSGAGTYAGVISGTGSLAKQNTGTLVLSGANSYSGGTTISAGTLQGTTTSLQGDITNNAALVFDQTTTGTYAGVISGTGSLTKQNTGTVILSGANTYSGGTTISAGTLQGNTTSLQGNITNNAALAFDQSAAGTYGGAISGTGSVTKQNSGTLVLSGANTYSGGTTISAGTLQGTTTSLQGNIANNAALVFDQSAAGTYAGVISGTGSFTKQNTGTLTLSGANTYSGGTTISAGTLQGTTTSLQGNIVNNAGLVFDQSTNGTYAGVISGTGAVTKQGSGTATLSGANTYSGATTVSGGTLALGATNSLSAASNLTLNNATTLALGGYSAQVSSLAYHTAIIDFGTAATTNYFLFTGGGTSTGTLTINNFNAGQGDVFAFQTGASGVSGSFVTGVYFYGIGGGVFGATGQTLSGYGGTWDFIVPDTTPFKTWVGGGGDNNWSTGANWSGGVAPTSGFGLKLAFDGSTRPNPVLDGNYNLNTLRFEASAGAFSVTASGGSALTFGGSVPGIIQLSANDQSLNVPLAFNTTTIVETSGAGALTLGGVISGSGGLTKVGGSTLILSGANTYTGETIVNSGTVVLRDSAALGSTSSGTTVVGGATLQLENNISVGAEALALDGTLRNASGTNAYGGAISGTGNLVVDAGTLTLSGSAANTYTGNTTVNSGTLMLAKSAGVTAVAGNLVIGNGSGTATVQLGANEQIADTAAVTLTAGGTPVFNVNGYAETIGSLASTNTSAAVQLGTGGSLTTGGNNASTTFAGVISGAGSLTKSGTGAFTLSGANTYSGATTVSAGTLVLQNSAALGSTAGGTTVNSGATLQLENNISVGAEALTLNGNLTNASGANSYAGAISGTGSVTVNGGSLSLGGTSANSYSGSTTVNSGTLTLAKSASTTAVAGSLVIGNGSGSATVQLGANEQIANTAAVTLTAGGTPTFNLNGYSATIGSLASTNASAAVQLGAGSLTTGGNNASTSFAGVISGTGSLTKLGSGTFTLSGANTYSGGTTVSAGTLQGNTTSLQGSIVNNAAVVFDQSANGTYAGVMSGSGALTKQNSGTLTLSGANTYSGGTTVSAGTLQGNTTSLQGNIANNAAVVFDQSSNGTYAGVMSGSGSLTKQNSGTLTLSGANTYSGGTTVSAGTLQGSSTSLQGNIANNAAVVFDQSSNGTYAGAMSGSGSLTKQNSGTLTLSGANTYSGGTTVNAGTLQGTTTSLQGNIVNNAGVVFDQTSSGTYAGVISGSGSLTKNNSGTVTLTGANSYTGATIVNGGTLALGASNVISDSSSLTLGYGSTLSLGGTSSERVNLLSFDNAAINFGTTGTPNYFLFTNSGTNSGTLTINNWTSGSDVFGVASNTISQTFLDNVLFAGINVGIGAVISGSATAVGSYGNFYTITPIPTFVWSGGQNSGNAADLDNWSKNNNWSTGIAPAVGATKAIVMAGTVQTTNDMDGAFQINSLLFRSDAGAFTINSSTGDTLTVRGGGINNQSSSTQTLNVPVALGANQSWTASSGNLVMNGAILNSTYTLTVTGNFNTTIAGVIGNGSGGIVKDGTGTLTLSGANTFTGGVTLDSGIVSIGSDGNLGDTSGGLTFNGGTLRTTAGITSARGITLNSGGGTFDSNGFDSTLSGVISGSGGLTKSGVGVLTLAGTNTYTGATTINAGTIAVSSNANLGNVSAGLILDGGTLKTTSGITDARAITLNSGGGTFDGNGLNSTLSGVVSGSGALTINGAGTLALGGTAANTYTGTTTLNSGTLDLAKTAGQNAIAGNLTVGNGSGAATVRLLANNQISDTSAVTLASGGAPVLNVNGYTETIGSLSSTNTAAAVQLGTGGSLSTGANNSSTTFAGVISGAGSLTKQGTGTLTLSGANTYSGGTTVSAGTLQGTTSSLQGNIANNATLAFDQSSTGTFAGVISGSGAVTKLNSGTLTLTGANSYTGATTVSAGTLTLGASNVVSTATSVSVANGATLSVASGSANVIAGLATGTTSTVNIGSGATLTISSAGDSSLLGALTGSGTLAMTGGGNLTLGNNINFASGTLVFGGATIGGTPTSTIFLGSSVTLGTLHITGDTILDFGNATATTLNATNFLIDANVKVTITNWALYSDLFMVQNWSGSTVNTRGAGSELQVTFAGFSNSITAWQDYGVYREITPAPEPATYGAMMMSAALGLLGFRRWRNKRPSATV